MVAPGEAVETRVGRDDRTFEGGDGVGDVVNADRALAEHQIELLLISGDFRYGLDHRLMGIAHLDRILDRALGLILERRRPPIPELERAVGSVGDGGRPAAAELAADPFAGRALVGPA